MSNTRSNWVVCALAICTTVSLRYHKHTFELNRCLFVRWLFARLYLYGITNWNCVKHTLKLLSLCALTIRTTLSLRYHKLKLCQTHARIESLSLCDRQTFGYKQFLFTMLTQPRCEMLHLLAVIKHTNVLCYCVKRTLVVGRCLLSVYNTNLQNLPTWLFTA